MDHLGGVLTPKYSPLLTPLLRRVSNNTTDSSLCSCTCKSSEKQCCTKHSSRARSWRNTTVTDKARTARCLFRAPSFQQPLIAFCCALAACNRKTPLPFLSCWRLPRQSSLAAYSPGAAQDEHLTHIATFDLVEGLWRAFLRLPLTMVPGARLQKWSFDFCLMVF